MSTQLTITGRFVQGGLTLQPKKNDDGTPVLDKQTGKQVEECFIAVAVAKNDPQFPAYWAAYNAQARASFPNLFDANGNCTHPRFAWKMQDGDGIDKNGKSVAAKPGFAGHYVFKFATRYAPRCYLKDSHGNMTILENPEHMIKRGFYIALAITLDGNGVAAAGSGAAVPGLYASPNLVLFVAPGEEIITGPDPTQAFAGVATQAAPQGVPGLQAPALPGLAPPALPGLPTPPAGLPAPGVPAGLPHAKMPAAVIAPPALPGFPQMPGAAVVPTAPQYVMQPSAQGATREQLLANNWTDEALLAAGHMVRVG